MHGRLKFGKRDRALKCGINVARLSLGRSGISGTVGAVCVLPAAAAAGMRARRLHKPNIFLAFA